MLVLRMPQGWAGDSLKAHQHSWMEKLMDLGGLVVQWFALSPQKEGPGVLNVSPAMNCRPVPGVCGCWDRLQHPVSLYRRGMNDRPINVTLSLAIHCRHSLSPTHTFGLLETKKPKRGWLVLTVHMLDKQLSLCLHICILLADKSYRDAKSGCQVFFPPQLSKRFVSTALS